MQVRVWQPCPVPPSTVQLAVSAWAGLEWAIGYRSCQHPSAAGLATWAQEVRACFSRRSATHSLGGN
eukprot:12623344-Alexandrium_andersonii.AAC.1